MTELQPTPAINIHLVIHNNQTIEACILQQKHAQPTTRLALALTHKTHVLIHRILATPKTTHDHLTPALLIRGTTHVRPTQRKMQELTKTRAIRIRRGRIQLINEATRLALRSRELTRIRVIRLRTAVQPMTRVTPMAVPILRNRELMCLRRSQLHRSPKRKTRDTLPPKNLGIHTPHPPHPTRQHRTRDHMHRLRL